MFVEDEELMRGRERKIEGGGEREGKRGREKKRGKKEKEREKEREGWEERKLYIHHQL